MNHVIALYLFHTEAPETRRRKSSFPIFLYTAAGMGGSLRHRADALRCRACRVQLPEFSTGLSIPQCLCVRKNRSLLCYSLTIHGFCFSKRPGDACAGTQQIFRSNRSVEPIVSDFRSNGQPLRRERFPGGSQRDRINIPKRCCRAEM